MRLQTFSCFFVLLCRLVLPAECWNLLIGYSRPSLPVEQRQLKLSTHSNRREFFTKTFGTTAAGVSLLYPVPAFSAPSSTPSTKELERLQKGHARVQYLLASWDEVTKVCGTSVMSDTERKQIIRTEGGGGSDACARTPLRVQEYMGYKSTEDPLYKADKLMQRAASLVDPDSLGDYLDVVERYREKADQTALLAYTSSWGEANPNGSKEVIEDYLDQTKAVVKETESLLRSVLGYLNLQVLGPSANP